MKITNKYYDFSKIGKKIVHISDIHYYDKKDINLLNRVLNNIEIINPDFVCITGDITDISNVHDEEYFVDWLKKISNKYKTIIILGNHEYYIKKSKREFDLNHELIDKIKKIHNIYLLRNECVVIDNVNFIGMDFGIEYYYNGNVYNIDINKYVNKDCYNILLCHSPINIEHILNNNVDLVLCGHMHGGMVPRILRPIFKRRGIISPTKKLFPKYVYGLKRIGNTKIITTSGIRAVSRINKFYLFSKFFNSEIVIINI